MNRRTRTAVHTPEPDCSGERKHLDDVVVFEALHDGDLCADGPEVLHAALRQQDDLQNGFQAGPNATHTRCIDGFGDQDALL